MRFLITQLAFCFLSLNLCFSQNLDTTKVAPNSETEGAIKATIQLDRKEVPQNHTVAFTVKVSWQGDLDRYEISKLETPVLTNLEIVENSSSNWVGEVGGVKQAIKTYEFILKPVAMGMGYVDGLIIEYKNLAFGDTENLVTNRLDVKIIEPVSEKSLKPWIIGGGISLLLILASGGGINLVKRKKAKEAEERAKALEMIPIEDKYRNEFKQEVDLQNTDIVASFSSLSKVLRKYISEKYEISAMEMTSPQISTELSKLVVPENMIDQTDEVLRSCDVAKFSGGQVERTVIERAYTLVEEILNKNYDKQANGRVDGS